MAGVITTIAKSNDEQINEAIDTIFESVMDDIKCKKDKEIIIITIPEKYNNVCLSRYQRKAVFKRVYQEISNSKSRLVCMQQLVSTDSFKYLVLSPFYSVTLDVYNLAEGSCHYFAIKMNGTKTSRFNCKKGIVEHEFIKSMTS